MTALHTRSQMFTEFYSTGRSNAALSLRQKANSVGGQSITAFASGRTFREVDLDASEHLRVKYQCRLGECYLNAARIALAESGLLYCQGIARVEGFDYMNHAWLVREDQPDLAIDPTWRLSHRSIDFFGMLLPKSTLLRSLDELRRLA